MGKIKESISVKQLQQILQDHETEEYGAENAVDEETAKMIARMKNQSVSERRDILIEARNKMRRLYERSSKDTAKMVRGQRKHVRKVQSHLNVGFLRALSEEINHPDKGLYDNMIYGSPTIGPIQDSNVWKVDPNHEEKNRLKNSKKRKHFVLRKRGPDWMSEENKIRLWKESAKLRDSGEMVEIQPCEVKMEPTYGFGVEQGEYDLGDDGSKYFHKLRNCFDYRGVNLWSPSREKLTLTTNKQIIQWVAAAAVNGDIKPPPVLPSKRDVNTDIMRELEREAPEVSSDDELKEDISNLVNSMFKQKKLKRPHGHTSENRKRRKRRKIVEPRLVQGRGLGFIPGFCKLDFKAYYYQFAATNVHENIIALWDPESEDVKNSEREDVKTVKPVGKWRYFESSLMHFGNLHSVYVACRFSLLLENIIRKLLKIVASIYIDDSIIMERMELLDLVQEIVEELYEKIGWKMSTGKTESHTLEEMIRILGLEYLRSDTEMTIFPPEQKVQDAHVELLKLADEVQAGIPNFEQLEKLTGKLIFLLQAKFMRTTGCEMRTLGAWKPIEQYKEKFDKSMERAILVEALRKLAHEVIEAEPAVISLKNMNEEKIHIYTDAATGADIGGDSYIGGVIRTNSKDIVFSYLIPDWMKKKICSKSGVKSLSIGVYEALAVWAALILFEDTLKDKWIICHVDNSGDVFALTSGGSKCPATQGIVNAVSSLQKTLGRRFYFTYVRSAKNVADATTRSERTEILKSTLGHVDWRYVNQMSNDAWKGLWENLEYAKTCRQDSLMKLQARREEIRAKNLRSSGDNEPDVAVIASMIGHQRAKTGNRTWNDVNIDEIDLF